VFDGIFSCPAPLGQRHWLRDGTAANRDPRSFRSVFSRRLHNVPRANGVPAKVVFEHASAVRPALIPTAGHAL
jgi:hypothetical protein